MAYAHTYDLRKYSEKQMHKIIVYIVMNFQEIRDYEFSKETFSYNAYYRKDNMYPTHLFLHDESLFTVMKLALGL